MYAVVGLGMATAVAAHAHVGLSILKHWHSIGGALPIFKGFSGRGDLAVAVSGF
jgi:hypothetical protein